LSTELTCYCCSGKLFANCCGPLLVSEQAAQTPEQLMRSRYSAFVLNNTEYLKRTWAQEMSPSALDLDNDSHWLKLEILHSKDNRPLQQSGEVEFKAWFVDKSDAQHRLMCLHELSDFKIEDGHWVYYSGQLFEVPVSVLTKKQSCPCGSGKKYKHCCCSD